MKKLFTFLLLVLAAPAAFAKGNHFNCGIYMDFGAASASHTKSRLAFGIGTELELRTGHIGLVARPTVHRRGYKNPNAGIDVNVTYFDIPVTLEYSFYSNFSGNVVFLGAGAYAGNALGGNYKMTGESKTSMEFGESTPDNRSPVDYGIVLEGGYRLGIHDTRVGLMLMLGKKDVVPEERQTPQNETYLNAVMFYFNIGLGDL